MKLFLAILWTIVFISDIISCAAGNPPSWVAVFCPASIVVLDCWIDYIDNKLN